MKKKIVYQLKTFKVNFINECYIGISVFHHRIVFKCSTLPESSELGKRLNDLFKDFKHVGIRSESGYYKRLNGLRSSSYKVTDQKLIRFVVSISISKAYSDISILIEFVKRLNKFFIENNFIIYSELSGTYSIPIFTYSDNQITREYEEIQLV